MPRIFGFAIPFFGPHPSADMGRQRKNGRRPGLESLEGRTLMTTVIPSKGGSGTTQAFITKPDLYLLEGTVDTTGVQPKEIFTVTVNLLPNVPTKITISLDRSVSPKIDGYLSLNSGTSNATVSNVHSLGVFNTGPGNLLTGRGDNTPTTISFTPKNGVTGYMFTFAVAADNGGYPVKGSLPYAVDVNVQAAVSPPPAPDIVMDSATTTDASTVTATYDIDGASITQPLTFNIYRSASQTAYSSSDLIGTDTLSNTDTAALSLGHHQVKLNLTSGTLLPDPAHEFVFVVANPGRTIPEQNFSNNSSYFRIYVLGAISHGLIDPYDGKIGDVPAWEPQMAAALMASKSSGGEGFDNVIQFDWSYTSTVPFPGLAVKGGQSLANQVVAVSSLYES